MLREKTITLEDSGKQLTFKLRQMAATQLESWTFRLGLVLAAAGSDIPIDKGVEGAILYLAKHGFAALGKISYENAKPLLDEMLGCCYRVVDRVEEQVTVETADAYIENMMTLFRLRLEAFKVNFDFFGRGGQSASPEDPNTIKLKAG